MKKTSATIFFLFSGKIFRVQAKRNKIPGQDGPPGHRQTGFVRRSPPTLRKPARAEPLPWRHRVSFSQFGPFFSNDKRTTVVSKRFAVAIQASPASHPPRKESKLKLIDVTNAPHTRGSVARFLLYSFFPFWSFSRFRQMRCFHVSLGRKNGQPPHRVAGTLWVNFRGGVVGEHIPENRRQLCGCEFIPLTSGTFVRVTLPFADDWC